MVVTVMAMDGDTGVNDDVLYTLEDTGNGLIDGQLSFVINSVTGQISVNVSSLDREEYSSYTLTVQVRSQKCSATSYFHNYSVYVLQATEVNDTSKETTAIVDITILDNNDNLPVFDSANYTANVSELEDVGRTVLTVSAEDKDIVGLLYSQ